MARTHRIAVIPGDGIGKETTPEGLRVLDAAARRFGFDLKLSHYDWSCETYAKTGQLSPNLQLFGVFLTPEVRKGLNAKLAIDPKTSGAVVGKLLQSPAGQQLMTNVQSAAPGLTPELLQAGVSLAAQQIGGLDAIGVAKAIPTQTITIDLSQAAALGSKINLSYWKSQAIGTLLEKSLVVEGTPVNFN